MFDLELVNRWANDPKLGREAYIIDNTVLEGKTDSEKQKMFFNSMFQNPSKSWVGASTYAKCVLTVDRLDQYGILEGESRYFTPNQMTPCKPRSIRNVKYISCLYVDLDVAHEKLGMTPEEVFAEIYENRYNFDLPTPTGVVDTGRGLQLFWAFNGIRATKYAIELWKEMEDRLKEILGCYAFDNAVASDISRLMRIPYTINKKTGEKAKLLDLSGIRYTVEELKEMLLGRNAAEDKPTKRQLHTIEKIEAVIGEPFPEKYKDSVKNADNTIRNNIHLLDKDVTPRQLKFIANMCELLEIKAPVLRTSYNASIWINDHLGSYNIVKSLTKNENKISGIMSQRQILESRNSAALEKFVKDNPQNNHRREVLLFLYRLSQLHMLMGDENLALQKMLELNSMYEEPFKEKQIKALTRSANKYYKEDPYRYYGKKAIDNMVTGGQGTILPYFEKPKKACPDRSEYQKAYYRKRLAEEGKITQEEFIKERRDYAKSLFEEGYKKSVIVKMVASKFQVTERTARTDANFCLKMEKDPTSPILNKSVALDSPTDNDATTFDRHYIVEVRDLEQSLEKLEEKIGCIDVSKNNSADNLLDLYAYGLDLLNVEYDFKHTGEVMLDESYVFSLLMSYNISTVAKVARCMRNSDFSNTIESVFGLNSALDIQKYAPSEKQKQARSNFYGFKRLIKMKKEEYNCYDDYVKKALDVFFHLYYYVKKHKGENVFINSKKYAADSVKALLYKGIGREDIFNCAQTIKENVSSCVEDILLNLAEKNACALQN